MSKSSPFDKLSKENKLNLILKCYLESCEQDAWKLGWNARAEEGCLGGYSFEKMHLSLEIADTVLARRDRLVESLKELDLLNLDKPVDVDVDSLAHVDRLARLREMSLINCGKILINLNQEKENER